MKKSKTLIIIFSVCAVLWWWEMGSLLLVDGYEMQWINQVILAFTSTIAMITFLFQELDQ